MASINCLQCHLLSLYIKAWQYFRCKLLKNDKRQFDVSVQHTSKMWYIHSVTPGNISKLWYWLSPPGHSHYVRVKLYDISQSKSGNGGYCTELIRLSNSFLLVKHKPANSQIKSYGTNQIKIVKTDKLWWCKG